MKIGHSWRLLPAFPLLFLGEVACGAELDFSVSEIPLGRDEDNLHAFEDLKTAPLDDVPGLDLIVVESQGTEGRVLGVYFQRPDGGFPHHPDRSLRIKSDIVAYSTGDVRDEPGDEILFFTRSSCFSYSSRGTGYRENVQRLFHWDLLCDLPSPEALPYLPTVKDLDGDGSVEILAPGPRSFGLFRRSKAGDGTYTLAKEFPCIAALGTVRRREPHHFSVGLELSRGSPRPLDHLVHIPSVERASLGGDLLRTQRWIAAPVLGDLDGDGRDDLSILRSGAGIRTLISYLQNDKGDFLDELAPVGPLPKGTLRLVDVNNDARLDLLAMDSQDSETHLLRFYLNRSEGVCGFDLREPNHAMKISGYGLHPRFLDLDGDGRSELIIATFRIPAGPDLSGVTVEQHILVYRRATAGRVFEKRPTLKEVRRYDANSINDFAESRFEGDFSGRGIHDVLFVGQGGSISANRLKGKDFRLEDRPYWQHRTGHRIRGVEVVDVNQDGRSDVILRHARSLRVLVSKP